MADASTSPAEQGIPRRTAIAGTGVLAVTGAALVACGDDGGSGGGSAGEAPEKGSVIGKASEVEVGGATIFKEAETVVVQPKEGEFQAFSAICTHQGCVLDSVSDGTINCKCHGSKFKLDGSVANGPAREPLPKRTVTVNDSGEIVAG
ncbi:Rieske (2Fe-2S) protein [Thermocrispum municipale]|jgi:Rieske Fe-S protein|uniref:Rieske (2Fe-2S) protein n=1 Tax=Thermocrispum municipale TaxID=37926 RepID=UPI0003F7DD75|nr:Rieske (2Fe-2S) protein [Thermocrispum municipale]